MAAPKIDPKTIFTPDEWDQLRLRDDALSLGLVMHAWGVIALAVAISAWMPNPITWAIAVMVVGARQLGLAILMHEAAHGGLAKKQKVNDSVGQWLCGAVIGAPLGLYRPYHLTHHRNTQQEDDPDLGLAAHFPITKDSLRRKMIRDITGQTFYKQRILGLVKFAKGGWKVAGAAREATLAYLGTNLAVFIIFAVWASLGILDNLGRCPSDVVSFSDPYSQHWRTCLRDTRRERPVALGPHNTCQLAGALVDCAVLGPLPCRASFVDAHPMLPIRSGSQDAGSQRPDRSDGS
jgi:fatty acid desaturase